MSELLNSWKGQALEQLVQIFVSGSWEASFHPPTLAAVLQATTFKRGAS